MEPLDSMAKRRRLEEPAAPELLLLATATTEAPNPRPPGEGGDAVDRISGLPDAILGEIISLLSTKEAARTQTLASRWRRVWLATPLILDCTDLYAQPEDHLSLVQAKIHRGAAVEDLTSTVSLILSAHPGPGRRFCVQPHILHDCCATVDAWLRSTALDNLQELEIWEERKYWYDITLAAPPASVFRFSATLRVAIFCRCDLLHCLVEGIHLPHLKQLSLDHVSISEGSLHTMISSCPVLECLLLTDNTGFGCVRISSNSLRCIGVSANRYFSMDNLLLQEVMIVVAPCLERFLYLHHYLNRISLTVISAPKLEALGCLTGCLPTRVVVGTTAIEGLNVVSFTAALTNIKILAVHPSQSNLDMVIELMKCFPCLEKLYIESCSFRGMNRWRRKHRDFIKSFDIRLKTIVLKQYRGIRSQVNFASFFLLNARELESMKLGINGVHYNDAFFAEQHGLLQMEKRASRAAELHFIVDMCQQCVHVNHVRDLSLAEPFECRC